MAVPLIPIVAGSLLAGGGWLAGKSSGGGVDFNTELLTKKEYTSTQLTDSRQITNTSTYSPTINKTFDIQYNIASGYQSSISTKKEQAINQTPTVSPQVTPTLMVIPTTAQGSEIGGSASGGSAGFDYMTLVVLGGLGFGAYYLLQGKKKGGKK